MRDDNRFLTVPYKPSWKKAIAILQEVMVEADAGFAVDDVRRVCATVISSKILEDFAEYTKFKKGHDLKCASPLLGKLHGVKNHYCISIPGGDHVIHWKKGRKTVAITCEPYSLSLDELKDIVTFCNDNNLTVYISGRSWHFPGDTILIEYKSKKPKE